ncbi:hypothetical protein EH222_12270 [candidate division KSB1 bacterium]|nr:MAG: hypothetical protein EH222_12270 [candidate division KSB1 bacterium]
MHSMLVQVILQSLALCRRRWLDLPQVYDCLAARAVLNVNGIGTDQNAAIFRSATVVGLPAFRLCMTRRGAR